MPVHWRRIAWFVSFAIAVVLALWVRNSGYGWPTTLSAAIVIWVVLPVIISQFCAAVVLGRLHSRVGKADDLMDGIAEAIKGLPPEEAEVKAKRLIDEALDARPKRTISS
jgi:hypothetical protein